VGAEVAPLGTADAAVERQVALDMVRRALPALPVVVLLAGALRGVNGAWSASYALVLVLLNFVVAAVLLSVAARKSPAVLMGAALGGFLVRMGLLAAALYAVQDATWIDDLSLGATLLVTHIGLLIWETRYLSISLAFPALKPPRGD
jgi:hypothetical protein